MDLNHKKYTIDTNHKNAHLKNYFLSQFVQNLNMDSKTHSKFSTKNENIYILNFVCHFKANIKTSINRFILSSMSFIDASNVSISSSNFDYNQIKYTRDTKKVYILTRRNF